MWLSDEFVEVLRGGAVIFAFLVIVNPSYVGAASEFTVHRLQQYQLNGKSFGSTGSVVGVEATAMSESGSLHRKCVLVHLSDVTPGVYEKVAASGAMAMLVILPPRMNSSSSEARTLTSELEESMLSQQVDMAVYFAQDNAELSSIYRNLASRSPAAAKTAAASFFASLSSDGYQMVFTGSANTPLKDMAIANVQGQLTGSGSARTLPTIALVSHYDSMAAAPELSLGADSSGSGVTAVLEAARVLSRLYSAKHSQPGANVMFVLTSGGSLNYQGSKRFLEEQSETEDSLLTSPHRLALCLTALTASPTLHLHVSRLPKDGTIMASLWANLQRAAQAAGVETKIVHRKINVAATQHPWQHHRYALARVPAATISGLAEPESWSGLGDTHVDPVVLAKCVGIVNAAVIATLYGGEVPSLPTSLEVTPASVSAWQALLTAQPRSPQLLLPAGNKQPLTALLHDTLARYTHDVQTSVHRPDKLEPEFGFHSGTGGTMTAYATKPATFDLLLSLLVAAYLGGMWLVLCQLPRVWVCVEALLPVGVVVLAGKSKYNRR